MGRFYIRFVGGLFSYILLDEAGCECFSLDDAVAIAERLYGNEWKEVYNGQEGLDRASWLESSVAFA